MTERINYVIEEIIDQYLYADSTTRPWIIGFSGGKDSTVMLQLVWEAINRIKAKDILPQRQIYVVCNDTLIENPVIEDYVNNVLLKIESAAVEQGMPIQVVKTIPRLEDSLWVNMIGKGYPVPNNAFRWCTERLKIRPTANFITQQVDSCGEAIVLIGTRYSESQNRNRTMTKHSIRGQRLSKHPTQPNAFNYAPIRYLMLEEVWYIINTMPSPWGADNSQLFKIYADASADDYECPVVVTSAEHRSCGQSRFGCWMCTVVKEDKSLSALVEKGFAWLKPLVDYRNAIESERNLIENRMPIRRNGTRAVNDRGPYYPSYRASALDRLLKVQAEIQKTHPEAELISNQELIAIQTIWYRDLIFDYKVSDIYRKHYQIDIDMKDANERKEKESELLKTACKKKPDNFELIEDLLVLQKNKALLNRKKGLKDDIESRIEQFIEKENAN